MVRWGEMGRFNLEFLVQNLFISSLAVVPIGAALQRERERERARERDSMSLKDSL